MSLKPSKLPQGTQLVIRCSDNQSRRAVFVRRDPAAGKGRPACNWLRFPDFAGLNGPDDDGTCQMSDYELARRGGLADAQ